MLFCLFLYVSITTCFAEKSRSSLFFNGSLVDLQQQALAEGKPFMVWFYTDWCEPCDQMAGQTFGNDELQKYIDEYYLAYQINADGLTEQDLALATTFDVMFFPTLMVFRADGEVAWQSAGYRSAEDLLGVLSEIRPAEVALHPTVEPVIVTELYSDLALAHATPRDLEGNNSVENFTPTVALDYSPEAVYQTDVLLIEDVWIDEPELVVESPAPAEISFESEAPAIIPDIQPMPAVATQPIPDGPGTYQIHLSESPEQGYAVQVGVFAEYENVLRMVARLEEAYDQPVLVNMAELRGKPVFKVLMGSFPQYTKAYKLKQSYIEDSLADAIIVNLDQM